MEANQNNNQLNYQPTTKWEKFIISWYNGTWMTPKGKHFKQPYRNIYRLIFVWLPVFMIMLIFVQALSWLADFVNYVFRG